MKKVFAVFSICLIMLCTVFASGCFGVVPAAWVHFQIEGGRVYYSTDMYAQTRPHISYYENQEDNYPAIEIEFLPRILGPETVEYEGEEIQTTLVDISSYCDIRLTVSKSSAIYSAEKHVYLNFSTEPMVQDDECSSESTYVKIFYFKDVNLLRGNPNGHINGVVNFLEYK